MAISTVTKLLGFFCTICPFCIVARKFPDSAYAGKLRKMEKACPACRAYRKIKSSHVKDRE